MLYPNPVHNLLKIQKYLQHEEIVQVQIVDMQGQSVQKNIRNMPAGIFLQALSLQSNAERIYQIRSIRTGETNTARFIFRR
ncbi:MAG: T9SS type A sorting domain-containing protein [Chitinophagaceae bacterium]|nr:T9SS type A sorting domain-containing protein [Chitinophagaceae bacterium]